MLQSRYSKLAALVIDLSSAEKYSVIHIYVGDYSMLRKKKLVLLLFFVVLVGQVCAQERDLSEWVKLALSENEKQEFAISQLRQRGQEGLDALISNFTPPTVVPFLSTVIVTPEQERVMQVIDAVARQKHASFSGLYWHTDLSKAKELAASEGKPILSLRLLGTLDEEFC